MEIGIRNGQNRKGKEEKYGEGLIRTRKVFRGARPKKRKKKILRFHSQWPRCIPSADTKCTSVDREGQHHALIEQQPEHWSSHLAHDGSKASFRIVFIKKPCGQARALQQRARLEIGRRGRGGTSPHISVMGLHDPRRGTRTSNRIHSMCPWI